MKYAAPKTEIEPQEAEVRLRSFERSTRLAEIKAVYRSKLRPHERKTILCAKDAAEYLRAVWDKDRIELAEEFLMLCLNAGHETLGWVKVASGGFNSALADPRVVFSIALQTASSALIVAHNHPSGSLSPSEDDLAVTRRLHDAGKLLSIRLLDHIILTRESYFSIGEHLVLSDFR